MNEERYIKVLKLLLLCLELDYKKTPKKIIEYELQKLEASKKNDSEIQKK